MSQPEPDSVELKCTVRKCHQRLLRSNQGLTCANGHHFDRAKEGYWNLTQPQDKKSSNPGDHREAVLARHRWLQRGHAAGLMDELKRWLDGMNPHSRVLDLGCGDGTFGPALFPQHAASFCGIDLSKSAIKLAAKGWPEATWVLANADRGLPVVDSSIECVISLFGRRPAAEIRRVLRPDGCCIVAVPAEDDLIELREAVQHEGKRRRRIVPIIEQLEEFDLRCVEQKLWRCQIEIGPDEIADALAMTYRAGRRSEQRLIASIQTTMATLSADLLLFRPQ
ncbi:MAG: methyltransferase domain-containing protein [Planctomycetota bacterium]